MSEFNPGQTLINRFGDIVLVVERNDYTPDESDRAFILHHGFPDFIGREIFVDADLSWRVLDKRIMLKHGTNFKVGDLVEDRKYPHIELMVINLDGCNETCPCAAQCVELTTGEIYTYETCDLAYSLDVMIGGK